MLLQRFQSNFKGYATNRHDNCHKYFTMFNLLAQGFSIICYVQTEQSLEKENSYYKSTELYLFMHILSPELLSNGQKICEKDYCQKIFAVDVEESLTISRCHG